MKGRDKLETSREDAAKYSKKKMVRYSGEEITLDCVNITVAGNFSAAILGTGGILGVQREKDK